MIILVQMMISPSGSGGFLRKLDFREAVEASELTEATEVNEAGEVSKAWKITSYAFRVVFVFEFNSLRTNITLF